MNSKLSLIAILLFAGSIAAEAQTSDAETEAVINLLGVQKKEAIAKLVPVSGKDSIAFWKIYDEYQQANKANAKDRLKLYEGTAMSYQNMTPAIADSLAKLYFINRSDQEKALETYYKKIKAATNPITAFEFYQAEIYILTQVRAQIMQQIPAYGAFKAGLKK
ncbi:MAG: hypothetical protein C5B59_18355 [Bacteroidetes bacterium]|nr:MAG: hypothetical protein C5B59_18355 [Bacteroidota bacterium]